MAKAWDNTEEWDLYTTGTEYNNKIDLYAKTELNWNFYNGKQWLGINANGLPKWTFNICRSSINYFVAFIMSQKIKMQYSAENTPDEATEESDVRVKEFVELMSKVADMKWEKDKMDSKLRQLMLDGANTGDFCAYVYWDSKKETGQDEKGDFTTELVDGVNVMFGNPNNPSVEAQPYILITGREMISKLKEEAKANGVSEELIKGITTDSDNNYQAGQYGKVELDNKGETGKCNYVIKFWKKNGTVMWNKSTKYCPIRKDVDLGISRYPIAWGNWESIKNSYHGMPVIEGIIDNQISINQLFAMVSYWMKMSAFGKTIYDSTKLSTWSNKIGDALKCNGEVTGVVQQLQAGNFNAAILTIIDMAIKYTRDFIGANDALMGQVDPEQASGTAIIATSKQAAIPLGNISANRDQFIEDLGLIWGEFFLKKYKNRKVSYRDKGSVVVDQYNTEGISNILLKCKVDVGPSTYWSEVVGIQALDNLLKLGKISDIQYFERMSKMNVIPDCQGLVEDAKALQEQQAQMQQQQQMQQQGVQEQQQQSKDAQHEQMAQFLESLPQEVQSKILSLPPEQQEQTILQMMKDEVKNSVKGGDVNV